MIQKIPIAILGVLLVVMMVFTFVYLFIAFRKPKDSATATEEE